MTTPGSSSTGFSISLRVPSFVGSDIQSTVASNQEQGLAKTASRGSLDSWVVSLGSNAANGSVVMRRLMVARKDAGLARTAQRDGEASNGPREALVDGAGTVEPGAGWRQFVVRADPMAKASSGARSEPELVIYEVGSF